MTLPEMTLGEQVVEDCASLSLSLKCHPLALLREALSARGLVPARRLAQVRSGQVLSVAGLVLVRQRPGTAKGVIFLTLEDETAVANLIVSPTIYERYRKNGPFASFRDRLQMGSIGSLGTWGGLGALPSSPVFRCGPGYTKSRRLLEAGYDQGRHNLRTPQMTETLNAVVLEEIDGRPKASFKSLTVADLPDYDVLVDVAYSTVNYKDGLALTGKGRIARKFPMVCGIDLAGTVAESRSPDWKPGDRVVVNGWNLAETEWGGFIQKQRVRSEWLVRVPDAFSLSEAMAIGTAGYTAMLAVLALEHKGVLPGAREVLVTGAAGGVGSIAVSVLTHLGYQVAASTGRPETHDYLRSLGASTLVDRASLQEKGPPLQRERWGGAVDSVGGVTLANVLAQTVRHGSVAACGLAGGADFPGSVMPFILRGVSLLGVDSVMAPKALREEAWTRLATDLNRAKLDAMTTIEPLSKVFELAETIIRGQVRGRTVIDVNR